MNYNPYDNATVFRPQERHPFYRLMTVLMVAVTLGGFSYLAYLAYHVGADHAQSAPNEVPFVEAGGTPLRIQPTDPGGMKIPHRDKQIFNAMVGNPEDASLEQNASGGVSGAQDFFTEEEISALQNSDGTMPAAATPGEPDLDAMEKAVLDGMHGEIAPLGVSAPTFPHPVPKPAAPTLATLGSSSSADAMKLHSLSPAAGQAPTSAYHIQLGSFASEGDALSAWNRIKNGHGRVIGAHRHHVEAASVDRLGTVYRLQLMGFSTESDARTLCRALKNNGQDCLVKKSG